MMFNIHRLSLNNVCKKSGKRGERKDKRVRESEKKSVTEFIVDALSLHMLCLFGLSGSFGFHFQQKPKQIHHSDCKHHFYLNDNDCATMLKMTLTKSSIFFKIFYYGYYLVNGTMDSACSNSHSLSHK